MTRSSAARVRRRKVRQGIENELRRRGIHNPDSQGVREMVQERIKKREKQEVDDFTTAITNPRNIL